MTARVVGLVCALCATASAEPRSVAYVELLGKGGLWGVGYDYSPRPYLAFGAVASYYTLEGDRYATLSPYATVYPITRGHHRWFTQLGPQLQLRSTPSPVPEWQGMTTSSVSAELATGYEYRNKVVVRACAMALVGAHVAPWLGASIGWTF